MEETIRILVVDDEPDIRRICRILLENSGYTVLEAATGLEAVETIRRCPEIDLILMDIMMPDLDGYDACSRLRACSTAPVLFLTAKTQENDKRRAYDAGGDDYLAKPFSHAELMMKVESLLRRYRVYKNKSSGRMLRPGIVLDEENRRVLLDGAPLELTETEFSILQCLAQKFRVGREAEFIGGRVGVYDGYADGLLPGGTLRAKGKPYRQHCGHKNDRGADDDQRFFLLCRHVSIPPESKNKKPRLPDRERGFFDKTDAHDPSIVNRENSAVPGTPAEGKAQYGGGTAREFHPLPRKCAAQYAIVYATVYRTGTFFASPFGSVRKTYLRYRRS